MPEYTFPTRWRSGNEVGPVEPHDMHCPQCGSGLNYSKSRCIPRQLDRGQLLCYGGCDYVNGEDTSTASGKWAKYGEKFLESREQGCSIQDTLDTLGITEGTYNRLLKTYKEKGYEHERV